MELICIGCILLWSVENGILVGKKVINQHVE